MCFNVYTDKCVDDDFCDGVCSCRSSCKRAPLKKVDLKVDVYDEAEHEYGLMPAPIHVGESCVNSRYTAC